MIKTTRRTKKGYTSVSKYLKVENNKRNTGFLTKIVKNITDIYKKKTLKQLEETQY